MYDEVYKQRSWDFNGDWVVFGTANRDGFAYLLAGPFKAEEAADAWINRYHSLNKLTALSQEMGDYE